MSEKEKEYFKAKYQRLEDLPGIGPASVRDLKNAGFNTVENVATAEPSELLEAGLGEVTAANVISAAQKTLGSKWITGTELAKQQERIKKLTTGVRSLDVLLDGGIETTTITEVVGEFGCHSEDTRVLTPSGIRDWRELDVNDWVFGEENGEVVISTILEKFVYPFDGYLNLFESNRFNLLVTGNHTVPYMTQYEHRTGKGCFKLTPAGEVREKGYGYLQCKFTSSGKDTGYFDIQEHIDLPETEYPQKSRAKDLLKPLNAPDFMELVGYYVADGSPLRNEYATYPTIRNGRKIEKLKELADRLSLDYSVYEGSKIVIFHRDLGEYLLRCGEGAENKMIPPELTILDKPYLERLFKGLMECDARHNGYAYYTSSKTLRDQFLVLTLKLGYNPSYRPGRMREHKMSDGRIITNRYQPYYINIAYKPKGYFDKRTGAPRKARYKGKVWCFKTTSGNFFTVRKGQPTLSGNSGKSQLCQQLAVTVQLPKEEGGLDGGALYLDTENVFRTDRIAQLAESFDLDPGKVLKKIVYAEAFTSSHQMILLDNADEVIKENNIRLIIVDSVIAHFRSEYLGREMLAPRQQNLNKHLHKIKRLAGAFNLAVVVTNQVASTPDVYSGGRAEAVGGHILGHASATRLYIRKGRENLRVAKILASPTLPEGGEAPFRITGEGIVFEGDL